MYTGGDETCVERFILSAPSTRNHSYTGWHATRPDDKAYGIALCADAADAGIEAAREFILGLYMCGFGAFAVATECVYMPNVVKYMLILDSYLGKGCFFIFWGFLMWGKKPEWSAPGVLLLLQRHRRDSRAGSLPP